MRGVRGGGEKGSLEHLVMSRLVMSSSGEREGNIERKNLKKRTKKKQKMKKNGTDDDDDNEKEETDDDDDDDCDAYSDDGNRRRKVYRPFAAITS